MKPSHWLYNKVWPLSRVANIKGVVLNQIKMVVTSKAITNVHFCFILTFVAVYF